MSEGSEGRRAVRVSIDGKVQGVFFRASVEDLAQSLSLAGWVENKADGSVEALFQGSSDAVDRAVAFCRKGPENARVDRIEETDVEPSGAAGFRIR